MLGRLGALIASSAADDVAAGEQNTVFDVDAAALPSASKAGGKKRGRGKAKDDDVSFTDFFKDLSDHADTPFEVSTVRNVILVGVTRAGKTTLLKVLQNPSYVDTKMASMVSGTVNAHLHTFCAKKPDGSYLSINIVDTPGLFEIGGADKTARDNSQITSVIMDCLQNELTKIHRVFFCFSEKLGLTAPNVESIKLLLQKYPAFQGKCSLIVTMCENFERDELMYKEQQIRRDAAIPGMDKMPIFFSGSIDGFDFRREEKDRVMRQYLQVKEFRQKLVNHILNDCDEPMKLDALVKYEAFNTQLNGAMAELRRRIPIIVEQASQPIREQSFYEQCKEVLVTANRLLENPLSHMRKGELATELKQFFSIIESDAKLKEMAESYQ